MPIAFQDLLEGVDVCTARGLELPVMGVHYDSRQVQPGDVFVCIQGYQTDGHLYIEDAAARGAAGFVIEKDIELPPGIPYAKVRNSRLALAAIAANFYGHPSRLLSMIGVTGTNGKTTTTHLIEAVLRAGRKTTGLIGTIWNKIDDKKLPVVRTTPESLDLQALLREMVGSGVETVMMEVSSHALYLDRVAECEFDVGVFTNLTQDHLDFHSDLSAYLAAKMRLFQGLGANRTKKRPCYAVINVDDPAGLEIKKNTAVPVITYGIRERADVRAEGVHSTEQGSSFTVSCGAGVIPFTISLPGEFNVYNSLAAISVGLQEGISLSRLQDALQSVKSVPGRFEPVDAGQNFTVIVDYAHTPDGLKNVLQTARRIARGRLITVFGCGGDRDAGKRAVMGKISGKLSDYTVLTSDNPRTEDPESIIQMIEAGIKTVPDASYTVVVNRYEAIRQALHYAEEGDIVIIAGKGHETYQIIGERTIPFDDHQVAREILVKEIIG